MPGGVFQEGDPFGNEATSFIKEQIMQKEVEIEVETIDKGKKRIKINTGSLSLKFDGGIVQMTNLYILIHINILF